MVDKFFEHQLEQMQGNWVMQRVPKTFTLDVQACLGLFEKTFHFQRDHFRRIQL